MLTVNSGTQSDLSSFLLTDIYLLASCLCCNRSKANQDKPNTLTQIIIMANGSIMIPT